MAVVVRGKIVESKKRAEVVSFHLVTQRVYIQAEKKATREEEA